MPSAAMQTEASQSEVFGTRLASGTIFAQKKSDGTVVVENVPFFSEIRPEDAGVKLGIREPRDRAWLERALNKHHARRVLGETPAMNLRHIFDQPERVGSYELTHLALAEVNPDEEPRWTLMGRKVYENEQAFEKSKDHDFRSAEISPDQPDELAALALLRDKMPFHRYANTREQLGSPAVEAFEAWSGKGGSFQTWRGGPESFMGVSGTATNYEGAREPYAVAKSMANKGEITQKRVGEVGDAIKRENHESQKEAPVAETKSPEKGTDYKAQFESMMAKTFEAMMAACHAAATKAMEAAGGAKSEVKKEGGTEEPEKAEAKGELDRQEGLEKKQAEKAEHEHKGEHQATAGPDAVPAITQAAGQRPITPETFEAAARAAKVGLLSQDEKLELLGLRSYVKQKQHEEAVEQFALAGEQSLKSANVEVDAEIRSELRASAKELGKPGVDRAVATITRFAKNASRAPEAFGALADARPGRAALDDQFKKAVETFGSNPGRKARLSEMFQEWQEMGEHARRSMGGSFYELCEGMPEFNPEAGDVNYWRKKQAAAKNGSAK
jgi:hypothetical protein